MTDDRAFKAWLRGAVKRNAKHIESSSMFLSIFTENYERDPLCALQLGIAIMLDKPVCLLVPNGTKIPENMRRLARAIEFFDPSNPEGIQDAGSRLVAKFREDERRRAAEAKGLV